MKSKKKHQRLTMSFGRKAGRIMLIGFSFVIGCAMILTGWLLLLSPGTVEPYRDKNGKLASGSISEKIFIHIGGVQQGMFIRSKDIHNPVLLFLHGGPGMPTFFLTKQYPTELEEYFTVCYWEQRDAGISYSPDITAESVTVNQLISDGIEVTNYLRERFGQEKIYLMGHSWGSFFGIQIAAQAPDLYESYLGVSQITNQLESEKLAYQWMLEQYMTAGNKKRIEQLKKFPMLENEDTAVSWFKNPLRDTVMHETGIGTMHDMGNVFSGIFIPFLKVREYSLLEKYNTFFRAKPFLKEKTDLIEQLLSTDITAIIKKIEIPVYFFSGIYDLTVNHKLNKEYFDSLQAPAKKYYTFYYSAHCPMHEEPEKFIKIMIEDILKKRIGSETGSVNERI